MDKKTLGQISISIVNEIGGTYQR